MNEPGRKGVIGSLLRRARRSFLPLVALVLFAADLELAFDLADPPPIERIARWPRSRVVLAEDGTWIRVQPNVEREIVLAPAAGRVPPNVAEALIASEDRRFRFHRGVDLLALVRAALSNTTEQRVVSGASTLTMQLARILEPRPRTILGKLGEMRRARQIERRLGKDEILAAYVTLVPLGSNLRGFEAAARRFFGRSADELTLDEAATIVAMLPAPSRRAPDRRRGELEAARRRVFDRIAETIRDPAEAAALRAELDRPITARRTPWPFVAPHFADLALVTSAETVVHTRLDRSRQAAVEAIVARSDAGVADGIAVVVVDRGSLEIRALVGARNWLRHPLNAAICRRAAGSTLKPFLYALALDAGITAEDRLLDDRPVNYGGYAPRNFGETFAGRLTTREALVQSRNIPAVKLLEEVSVEAFTNLLRALGLPAGPRDAHLAAALGTLEVSPLELASAYARFAGPGILPGASEASRRRVLAMLSTRTPHGDLAGAGAFAWKTGTSSDRRDAWCVAVGPTDVVVVWLGNRSGRSAPDLVGARSAARIAAEIAASDRR